MLTLVSLIYSIKLSIGKLYKHQKKLFETTFYFTNGIKAIKRDLLI